MFHPVVFIQGILIIQSQVFAELANGVEVLLVLMVFPPPEKLLLKKEHRLVLDAELYR